MTRAVETTPTFEAYRDAHPDARFTDWLRARTKPAWTEATEHRFVEAMATGEIDDTVMEAYLVQDYAFVTDLIDLFGHAVARAPALEAKRPFIEFLELVTSDENDYFERAFDALDVPDADRSDPEIAPTTERFSQLLAEAGQGSYADALSVLVPVEWVYLDWGRRLARDRPRDWLIRDWIDLHANPGFEAFVSHMHHELDREGEQASREARARLATRFETAVELEVAFWEQAYELATTA